jgi:hypothetical protein
LWIKPGVADVTVGGPGTVGTTTAALRVEAELVPTAFFATTTQV